MRDGAWNEAESATSGRSNASDIHSTAKSSIRLDACTSATNLFASRIEQPGASEKSAIASMSGIKAPCFLANPSMPNTRKPSASHWSRKANASADCISPREPLLSTINPARLAIVSTNPMVQPTCIGPIRSLGYISCRIVANHAATALVTIRVFRITHSSAARQMPCISCLLRCSRPAPRPFAASTTSPAVISAPAASQQHHAPAQCFKARSHDRSPTRYVSAPLGERHCPALTDRTRFISMAISLHALVPGTGW